MSEIRKDPPKSPVDKHRSNIGVGGYNRFNALDQRDRSFSLGKRRLPPTANSSNGTGDGATSNKVSKLDANTVFAQLRDHDKCIENAKAALAIASNAIGTACKPDDGGIGTALFKLVEVLDILLKGSETMKSSIIDVSKVNDSAAKGSEKVSYAKAAAKPTRPPPTEEEIAKAKVKKVLRDAEKKLVIFDLNLGSAPTINKETISKKVTYALHDMAKTTDHDLGADAAEVIDDVLSCSQLEFLGKATKKFYNNKEQEKDSRHGKMCTMPIRMDFKSKEIKHQAESTLRKVCKVSCSTPYPKRMRQLLAEVVKEGKAKFQDTYIRTKVDIENLKISAFARNGDRWVDLAIDRDITEDILDRYTPPISLKDLEKELEKDEEEKMQEDPNANENGSSD